MIPSLPNTLSIVSNITNMRMSKKHLLQITPPLETLMQPQQQHKTNLTIHTCPVMKNGANLRSSLNNPPFQKRNGEKNSHPYRVVHDKNILLIYIHINQVRSAHTTTDFTQNY